MHTKVNLHHLTKQQRKKLTFEGGLLVISTIGPISSIPQILKIWSTQSAGDLSLYTWLLYALSATGWIIYGLKLKSVPLIANNMMWVTVYGFVLVGILRFG